MYPEDTSDVEWGTTPELRLQAKWDKKKAAAERKLSDLLATLPTFAETTVRKDDDPPAGGSGIAV